MDNRVVRYQSGGPQWRQATGEDGSGPGGIRRCDGGWRWAAGSVVTTSRHGLDAEVAWRCEAREGEEAGAGERCRGERGRAGAVLRQSSQGGRRKAESQVRRSTQGPAAIACPGCSALCPAAWSQQALPGQLVQRGEVDLERPSAQPPCRRERLSGRQSGPPRTPHAGSAAETPGKHLGSPRLVALSGSLSSLQRVPGPPVHLIDHGCWRLHHTGAEASNVCRTNHQRGSAHGVVSIRPFGSAPPAGARHHATAGLQQKCETFMDVRGSPPRPRARPQTTPTATALCQHRRPKGPRHPSKHRFLAGVDDTQHRRRQSSEPLAAQSAPSSLVVAAAAWRTSPTLSISPMTDAEDPPDSECSFPLLRWTILRAQDATAAPVKHSRRRERLAAGHLAGGTGVHEATTK